MKGDAASPSPDEQAFPATQPREAIPGYAARFALAFIRSFDKVAMTMTSPAHMLNDLPDLIALLNCALPAPPPFAFAISRADKIERPFAGEDPS